MLPNFIKRPSTTSSQSKIVTNALTQSNLKPKLKPWQVKTVPLSTNKSLDMINEDS